MEQVEEINVAYYNLIKLPTEIQKYVFRSVTICSSIRNWNLSSAITPGRHQDLEEWFQ